MRKIFNLNIYIIKSFIKLLFLILFFLIFIRTTEGKIIYKLYLFIKKSVFYIILFSILFSLIVILLSYYYYFYGSPDDLFNYIQDITDFKDCELHTQNNVISNNTYSLWNLFSFENKVYFPSYFVKDSNTNFTLEPLNHIVFSNNIYNNEIDLFYYKQAYTISDLDKTHNEVVSLFYDFLKSMK
jgi:hypothetical protein